MTRRECNAALITDHCLIQLTPDPPRTDPVRGRTEAQEIRPNVQPGPYSPSLSNRRSEVSVTVLSQVTSKIKVCFLASSELRSDPVQFKLSTQVTVISS